MKYESIRIFGYGVYILVPEAIYVFDLDNNITYEKEITSDRQQIQAQCARDIVEQEEKSI